jgi:hypothetical protein
VDVPAPIVNLPPQPTPIVHVQPPDLHVTVEQPRPRAVRVEYDNYGNKVYVPVDGSRHAS